ncbi:MAG TPA: metallopeptidase TldD-related protein [Kofleriaceae bacterium]|nr:metallopeptidase TldD-related protein [Kofleriaceae bacterium]
MSWSRREVLATLGVASAQAILVACGAPQRTSRRGTQLESPEIRTWLRDAVSVLRGAGFENVHVLAVRRNRITAALDVLGGGVARSTSDGVVMSVRDRDGARREHVTNTLSRDGVAEAARVLAGSKVKAAKVDFGMMPPLPLVTKPDPGSLTDGMFLARVAAMAQSDRDEHGDVVVSSRIVYSAALIDVDDAHVWSVAPGRDLEQRNVRIRKSITRVAWNGTRPVVAEAARAYAGGIDEFDLPVADIAKAREDALALMTPTTFPDGEHVVLLEPGVAAALIDAAARAMLTTSVARRPEVAARLAKAPALGAAITLVDDPRARWAYGGYEFDDAGVVAQPISLIERGKLSARIGDGRGRRAGHVGTLEPQSSHLRLTAGRESQLGLLDKGFVLEGVLDVKIDPASDRLVVSVARARERVNKTDTGRVFADIELVGSLAQVLGSVDELSSEVQSIGFRDERNDRPRWRSVETPWLRTKALLRARRGLT